MNFTEILWTISISKYHYLSADLDDGGEALKTRKTKLIYLTGI